MNIIRFSFYRTLAILRLVHILWLLALVLIFLSGCYSSQVNYRAGSSLNERQVRKIKPGQTHKEEVLQWFGPPIAIARWGKIMRFPAPDMQRKGFVEQEASTFFELFNSKHSLGDKHIIYYYYDIQSSKSYNMVIMPVLIGSGSTKKNELWILIDTHNGLVLDTHYQKTH